MELSGFIRGRLDRSPRNLVFAIGGECGFAPADEAWAEHRLRLGAITLPHELARAVLVEQLYRSLTIIRNIQYHK